MSFYDSLAGAPLIGAAAATPSLTDDERKAVNGFAAITSVHKRLLSLSREQANREFGKLNKDVQESLKYYFQDEAEYLEEGPPTSLLGKAAYYAKRGVSNAGNAIMDTLTNYADSTTAPFRAAVLTGDASEFLKEIGRGILPGTKMKYRGGEKQFVPEREQAVDGLYDKATARVAKMLSMGKDMGEIMSEIETDEEWLALEQFTKGEGLVGKAREDYDNAKISYGREFGRLLFQIEPGERGLKYQAYRRFSGAVDAASAVLLDPTFIVGKFVSAAKVAQRGTMALVRVHGKGGDAALIKKVDDMFDSGLIGGGAKVTEFWNRAGELIQKTTVGSRGERALARAELRRYAPEFTEEAIDVFAKSKVFDAEGAKTFLKNVRNVERIMGGRAGQESFVLPTHTATRQIKLKLKDATTSLIRKDTALTAPVVDDIITTLEKGESIADMEAVREIRSFGSKFTRMFERSLRNRVIEVGEDKAKSANDIYTLARTVLPKMEARVISEAFAAAPDNASARSIVRGLFDTIADAAGVTRLGDQKAAYEEIVEPIFNPKYSENIIKDNWIKSKAGYKDMEQINPALMNGAENAVAVYQLADKIQIADYAEIFKLASSKQALVAKGMGAVHHSRFLQHVVDYWSAFNLLPRLGIRAVLDETLFHSLTMPAVVALNIFNGRVITSTIRRLNAPQRRLTGVKKTIRQDAEALGIPSRIFNNIFNKIDVNEFRKLRTEEEKVEFLEKEIFASTVSLGKLASEDTRKYAARFYKVHGPKFMEAIGEGVSQSVSGSRYTASIASLPDDVNLNLKVKDMLRDIGKEFGDEIAVISKTDDAYKANYMAEMSNRVDRNGEIGKIAVTFMDNPDKAVAEITAYFRGVGKYADMDGKEVFKRFQISSNATESDLAFRSFIHVRNLFMSDNGTLNKKMLDRVRRTDADGKLVIDGKIDPEDIDDMFDVLPSNIKGYEFTGNKMGNNQTNFVANLIDLGFRIADRQLATLSRQPAYAAYYLGYSKKFAANEKRFVDELLSKDTKMTREQAEALASERYGNLAAEMAYNRMLGYIDNPNVRSNFALGIRNFARYYRAQEDFYRRVMRTANLVENPTALVRFRLMSEGVDHSGWFHEDQNGDKYFVFPADEFMYNVLNVATGNKIAKPMPLKLTGKIKMVTPSLDPESAIPTFSSPISAILVRSVMQFIPPDQASTLERAALGQYAANRNIFYQTLPSVFRRAWDAGSAMLGEEWANEQAVSAGMKAAVTWTGMGKGLDAAATIGEREEWQRGLWQTARNITFLRNILGIFAPVSPQVSQIAELDDRLLDAGVASLKTEYNELVRKEIAKGTSNPYDVALNKFTRLFPGAAVYTVSESDTKTVAQVQQTEAVADFVKRNSELFKKYPQGAAFMVPNVGEFSADAYAFLKAEGFMKRKDMDDFLEQVATINEENAYYDMRKRAEEDIKNAYSPELAAYLRDQWDITRKEYFRERPYLTNRFEKSGGRQAKVDALQDLEALVNSGDYDGPGVSEIREIISVYSEADGSLFGLEYTDYDNALRALIKKEAFEKMQSIASGTPNAEEVVENLIRRLMDIDG